MFWKTQTDNVQIRKHFLEFMDKPQSLEDSLCRLCNGTFLQ